MGTESRIFSSPEQGGKKGQVNVCHFLQLAARGEEQNGSLLLRTETVEA